MDKRNIWTAAGMLIVIAFFSAFFVYTHRSAQSAPPLAPRVATSSPATTTASAAASVSHQTAPAKALPATPSTSATASTSLPAAPPETATSSVTIPVYAHETVLDAMQAYASSSSFSYTGQDYPSLGLFVETIDGRAGAGGYGWFLYINGSSSELGASSAQVAPGDTVQWRYEKDHY